MIKNPNIPRQIDINYEWIEHKHPILLKTSVVNFVLYCLKVLGS
ncbi:unnamed protein product [Meloidogyne enterolobii]|uniref:Uncharacterized protein n=1 Tax=Meloidogyne enterolobii TaxID=390850 RepID=A0ACB1ARX6_MELEN